MTGVAAVAVLLSYLAGSISFPYWVARLRGVDLRTVGSRKLGGSNLWKSVGPGEAIVGGLLDAAKGFVLLPRRWVVERTFAWLNRNRRLAKDVEATIESSVTWLYIASVKLMSRRLAAV